MSTRVVDRIDDWEAQSFSDGYRGLHDLADREFSGVVRAGGAELFMTKGVAVGLRRGSIEDFESETGTAYRAPTPALPLLAIMQERSEEVRAEYYTENTPISEVDRTLSDGGFTGFVELSENVLSGDYYLVYHRGRSMSVAYVGNSKRLIHGDEAFEQADDEVGIYEVRPVDIEAIDIPDPEPTSDGAVAAGASERADASESDAVDETTAAGASPSAEESAADGSAVPGETAADEGSPLEASAPDGDESTAGSESPATDTAADSDGHEPADVTVSADAGESPDDGDRGAGDRESPATETDAPTADSESAGDEPTANDDPSAGTTDPSAARTASDPTPVGDQSEDAASESDDAPVSDPLEQTGRTDTDPLPENRHSTGSGGEGTARKRGAGDAPEQTENVTSERAMSGAPGDLETRSIPSLDPELSRSSDREGGTETDRSDTPARAVETTEQDAASSPAERTTQSQSPEPQSTAESERAEQSPPEQSATRPSAESATDRPTDRQSTEQSTTDDTGTKPADSERVEELMATLEDKRARIQELERDLAAAQSARGEAQSARDEAESARDEARAELASVQAERDELEDEVERLQSELSRLEEELGAKTGAERRLSPQEALDGTDIFVRYHSKGDGTLEKAHDSGRRKEDVTENLRLEKHTQFDAAAVSIEGQSYDEFLETRIEFAFVAWVVRDLLFEIQNTGHTESLQNLYDAVPKINRIELNGEVTTTDEDDTETRESFDVVCRARMGDPLLVANINESRQGASQSMMESLITSAERVGRANDEFAAAFLVTESFFEPEALETVAEATRGGLLSRDKRKSFVNLSRKRGYHLCLVEARNENFHLEVPEL